MSRSLPLHAFGRTILVAMLPLACMSFAAGCRSSAPKYQVVTDESVVSVGGADLGVSEQVFGRTGRVMLRSEPTKGLFPAAICVVRVEAFMAESDARLIRVVKLPTHHAVYWNHLFDELPAVREVVFLGRPSLDPRGHLWDDVLSTAEERECGLCVIYARLESTDADAEYVGILWDVTRREALASIRVPVVLPPEVSEELEEDPVSDNAVAEADFRSEQEFRRIVRDLLWDMAKADVFAPTTRKNPWQDYLPPIPLDSPRAPLPGYERRIYNAPGLKRRNPSTKAPADKSVPKGDAAALHAKDGDAED